MHGRIDREKMACAADFYGGSIDETVGEKPKCPPTISVRRARSGWSGTVSAATSRGWRPVASRWRAPPTSTAARSTACHFGEKDHLIPLEDVEKVRATHPEVSVFLYPAGHGFMCEERENYHAESAAIARQRALAFLAEHLK